MVVTVESASTPQGFRNRRKKVTLVGLWGKGNWYHRTLEGDSWLGLWEKLESEFNCMHARVQVACENISTDT